MTVRTDRGGAFAGAHCSLDTLFVCSEPGVVVHKSLKEVAAVWNRYQFHGAEARIPPQSQEKLRG
jgi:hypothetical protein